MSLTDNTQIWIPGGCKLLTIPLASGGSSAQTSARSGTYVNPKTQGSGIVLAQTPDTPSLISKETVGRRVGHTSASGPLLAAYTVHIGRYLSLAVPALVYDIANLRVLARPPGASADGQLGTLGGLVTYFPLWIVPNATGGEAWEFPFCEYIDTIEIGPHGILEKMFLCQFAAWPDPANLGTATSPYYLKGTA